jgi:2-oxoglutarate ferredoxin oxidoreductase subunit alpha
MSEKKQKSLETVVARFAGDSGDGMQITGTQFTNTAAVFGNDLATFPDFPAEIRAPAGTLPGVSGFQVHFSSTDIDLPRNGILIVDTDAFDDRNLRKAGYMSNPLEDGTLAGYRVFALPLTALTEKALRDIEELTVKEKRRCKNFYALGMMYWLFSRSVDTTVGWLEKKFAKKPALIAANATAVRAGYAYCDASEEFQVRYEVTAAPSKPGIYRNVSGNEALSLGLLAASVRGKVPLFCGSYPITPASPILHELARHKNFGVVTFQAEDEIAAVGASIGAAFGGHLAVTSSSGPGIALKTEAIGLAVMVELPLVVVNVQRAGPSTGLPTKTEQSDLMQALFGRNGEAPVPVLAASTPADCFETAFEAARIAVKYMVPVILLSDGYLANGAEPCSLPTSLDELPDMEVRYCTDPDGFQPYSRDETTLARPWAWLGTPGLEHRIGGLEKEDGSGNISYDSANHQRMTNLRAEKVARIANDLPELEVFGPEQGTLLVIGWGSTYGAIHSAVKRAQAEGVSVAQAHLRHLNPFPSNLGDVLGRYEKVLVPEMNMGQLLMLLRARYLVDAVGLNKMEGQPFKVSEVLGRIREMAT